MHTKGSLPAAWGEVAERVLRVVATSRELERDTLALDSTFADLGIDSLDGMSIAYDLEDEFGIEIPDEAIRYVQSLRDIADRVWELAAQKNAAGPPGATPAASP